MYVCIFTDLLHSHWQVSELLKAGDLLQVVEVGLVVISEISL